MHTVVIRKDLLQDRPGLAHRIYRAFSQAKDASADRYRRDRRLYQVQTMVPWMNALIEGQCLAHRLAATACSARTARPPTDSRSRRKSPRQRRARHSTARARSRPPSTANTATCARTHEDRAPSPDHQAAPAPQTLGRPHRAAKTPAPRGRPHRAPRPTSCVARATTSAGFKKPRSKPWPDEVRVDEVGHNELDAAKMTMVTAMAGTVRPAGQPGTFCWSGGDRVYDAGW